MARIDYLEMRSQWMPGDARRELMDYIKRMKENERNKKKNKDNPHGEHPGPHEDR